MSKFFNWRRIFNHGWQSDKEIFLCLLIPMLGIFNSQPKSESQSPINVISKVKTSQFFVCLNVKKKIQGLDLKWMWQALGTVYLCAIGISR